MNLEHLQVLTPRAAKEALTQAFVDSLTAKGKETVTEQDRLNLLVETSRLEGWLLSIRHEALDEAVKRYLRI